MPQYTSAASADSVFVRAQEAFRRSELRQASELNNQAEQLYRDAAEPEGLLLTLDLQGRILIRQGRVLEARELLSDAIASSPESRYRAKLHNSLSSTYNTSNEYQSGLEELYNAIAFMYRLPDTVADNRIAGIYQNLAILLSNSGRTEESFRYFAEAVRFAEKADNTLLLSTIHNNLGVAYARSQQLDIALFHLLRAVEFAREMNTPLELYQAHLNLGNTYTSTGLFEDALEQYDAALAAFEILQPGIPSVIIMHNQGRTLALMRRYDEAERLLQQSLAISEAQNIMEGIYHNVNELGKMYAAQNQTERALPYFYRAADIAETLRNSDFLTDTLEELHRLHARRGQFEDAYNKLLRYQALSDSLSQARYTKELALAENYLELSRQREINSLLQEQQLQKNRQLRTQSVLIVVSLLALLFLILLLVQMKRNAASKQIIMEELEAQKLKLEEANKAKDKLFAIVSHDLRNALISMEGILTLLKEDEISMSEFRDMIPEVEAAIQENSLVMTDLLTWAKEQLSGVRMDLKTVEVSGLIGEVLQSQKNNAAKKKIAVTAELPEVPAVLADHNALTFVLRNLISNAIKFTKSGGQISIAAEERADSVVILIRDTGIGMSEAVQHQLFTDVTQSRKGTANERGTGFGLKLSHDFAVRMNGSLRFESTEGEGSTFFVELPKAG
ncbi:MAG: tetratricopeptide repeat protein [Candidatus Cyclonatronum sp.]|uniref:ATP-binding protein n=1 Tax=Cyclonatronum sp. TaxID=3024185 RepID=UPI0025BFA1F0|nr:tetratricopeptide repeat-containing sensor histidine kinase [Cyclonatronum sp.]MCH8488128.1 tetratricopeptide repeat protein [Cyclonatronum sp.]